MKSKRRHNRREILTIAARMAEEFEGRAQAAGAAPEEIHLYMRTAKYMRELLSIADGTRSPAYWVRYRSGELSRVA